MKEKRGMAMGFAGLAISLICLGLSLFYGGKASLYEMLCFLSLESAPLSSEAAGELQEELEEGEQEPAVCFYREESLQWLTNEELNRSVRGSVTVACGNTQLLFPESSALTREDQGGCLLGEELAYELFGNKNAVGRKLLFHDRELEVRGMLREAPKTVAVQANMDAAASDGAFSFLAVRLREDQTTEEVQQEFGNRYGIQGQIIAADLYGTAAKAGGALLYVGVFLCLFLGIVKVIWKYRSRPAVLLALCILIFLSGILIKKMIPYSFSVGKEDLPSQWSDFAWYTAWFKQKMESFEGLARVGKGSVLFYFMGISAKAMVFGALSLCTFFVCRRHMETGAVACAAVYSAGLSALWLAAVWALGRCGMGTDSFLRGWGLFSVYIWTIWAMKRIDPSDGQQKRLL